MPNTPVPSFSMEAQRASKRICFFFLIIGLGVLSWALDASAISPEGMVENPCPEPLVEPTASKEASKLLLGPGPVDLAAVALLAATPEIARYAEGQAERARSDWPNLCRYAAADTALVATGTAIRVVFLGDSVTENWGRAFPALFTGGIVNRGIIGQTTPQMMLRFQADVVALRPALVHILAGINDIAGNTGPTTAQAYKNNIKAMVEMAQANHIDVVLGSMPPSSYFRWSPTIQPAARISELNIWLEEFARERGLRFADYHKLLAGINDASRPELTNDGVHPNHAAYSLMNAMIRDLLN